MSPLIALLEMTGVGLAVFYIQSRFYLSSQKEKKTITQLTVARRPYEREFKELGIFSLEGKK